jgi:hypothetical protein
MFAQTLFIVGLTLGAPPEAATPRLEKGLEVRWSGTYNEATFRPGVRGRRSYDVDTRLFVLDTGEYGAEAILFTRVFQKPELKSNEPPAGVVRIDMVQINPRGQVRMLPSPADPDNPDAKLRPWPFVQLQGLPTHEAGMFVEFPEKPLKPGLTWTRQEAGRPDIAWKVGDADSFHAQPAMKLIAQQKTDSYYDDRIRQAEWRRQDTLTVQPDRGYAVRIQRIIERRDPDAEELSFRSVLLLEQQGRIVYSGRLYDERREESLHAAAFTAMLDRLLAAGGREGPKPFEALSRRVQTYLSDHGANDTVPYREAVLAVRKRAESAAKGNLPPATPAEETSTSSDPIAVGKVIPDITAAGITTKLSAKLSELKGKTVLLAYFQPSAQSGLAVMKLVNILHARGIGAILPLAIGDPADAKKIQLDEKTTVPIYDGSDVFKTHGLEATPVFIVVDSEGVVRNVIRGWGSETATTVTREFERWTK